MDLDFNKNEDQLKQLCFQLQSKVKKTRLGGGEKKIKEQHDKGKLTAEQILLINAQSMVVSCNPSKPSAESPLHVRLASEFGAGAVLHTHSVWSTTLSDLHSDRGGLAIERIGACDLRRVYAPCRD